MGLFSNQFSNVVEWQEYRDDVIFWKWTNKELKKGSRLIIRPGQDAVFMYNGRIEGIFTDEGNYEVESAIIPFLSTLKGFKFGFNSGLRAEVLFVNTKEFTVKWGTKSAINIPAQGLPGGMPIRAFGTYTMKASDYVALIDKVAGIKVQFAVDDVKERVNSVLDKHLMKWIVKEGKDMFNLQANSDEISRGIMADLDMEMMQIGISVTSFNISNVSYPEEIQNKINKTASYNMVGDIDRYQKVGMVDAMTENPGGKGAMSDSMGAAFGMAAGFNMANQMSGSFNSNSNQNSGNNSGANQVKCPKCGSMADKSDKFCPECGNKMASAEPGKKFCSECGAQMSANGKFCSECGAQN